MSTKTSEIDGERYSKKLAAGVSARNTLTRIGVADSDGIPHYGGFPDFHALDRSVVDSLVVEADLQKYRRPRSASGSRARYFYAKLVREANRVIWCRFDKAWK